MVVANPPLPVLVEGLGVLLGSGGVVRTVNPLSSTATFATREPRDQVLFKRSIDCTILHPRFPSFPFSLFYLFRSLLYGKDCWRLVLSGA